jgi:hypothetical protein
VLRSTGWVFDRRSGLWMHYRLADDLPEARRAVLAGVLREFDGLPQAAEDRAALAAFKAGGDRCCT